MKVPATRSPGGTRIEAGFSLVELGIVIAVIAVLGAVVLMGRGFIYAAKYKSAIDMISALRTASREFSIRNNGGASYTPPGMGVGPNVLSLDVLRGQGFVPQQMQTNPWGGSVSVAANGAAHALCAGNTCVQIDLGKVPDDGTPGSDCNRLVDFYWGNPSKGIAGQAVGRPACSRSGNDSVFTVVFR